MIDGQFASTELSLADITASHVNSMNIEVIEPLQRYKSTVFALRASVTSQRNKRANHIAANSAIQRDSVRNPNHDELVAKATRCLNEYVDASNRLDEDFRRYQIDRNDELLSVLQSLANLQVQHCQNCHMCWSELEKFLAAETSPQPFSGFFSDVKNSRQNSGGSSATGLWSHTQQSQGGHKSSSLLDLKENEDDEGRESEFYESV